MRWAGAEAATLGDPPVALVTMETPGGVLRLSSSPVSIEDTVGGPYHYPGGLLGAVDMDGSMDLLRMEGATSLRQVNIEAILPGGEDAAALEGGWWALVAARVEVALWWPGMAWADRLVLISGLVSGEPQLGMEGEPCRFSVEAMEPASAWAVDPERDMAGDGFPSPAGVSGYGDLSGYTWPVIIGRVYGVPVVKGGVVAGPAYIGLIAGHALAPDVVVGSLTVYAASDVVSPTGLALGNETGTTGDYAAITATTDLTADDPKVFVDLASGGIANARRPERAATTAAGVLEHLLQSSGVRVDWQRMEETIALLRSWEIGLYLDDPASCLDVIREALLPVLPLVELQGPRGLWYAYVDPWTAPSRGHLTFGQELTGRAGALTCSDPSACRNSFVLHYAYDHYLDDFGDRIALNSDNYELCRYSRQLFGERAADPVKTHITWDAVTARRMAQHLAARYCLPRRRAAYTVDNSVYWLEEGQTLHITDADRSIATARAYVRRIRPAARPIVAEFELYDLAPVSAVLG